MNQPILVHANVNERAELYALVGRPRLHADL
jgi:hypothetical protein